MEHAPDDASLFGPGDVIAETRSDGSILVRSPHALGDYPRSITDLLDTWAAIAPDRPLLVQRDATGDWQSVSYAGARALACNLAQAFLDRRLSADRPIAILSGNGVEHALVALGAMYAGIPYASISPAYSLLSTDFGKLRAIFAVLTPGLVVAVPGAPFARAIEAVVAPGIEVASIQAATPGRNVTDLSALWTTQATTAVDAAAARVTPDTVAKILFTSGSTGDPKGVINTQRMLTANQAMLQHCFPFLRNGAPTIIDWLPWSHTFGANHNFGIALTNGGTFYFDDGKPLPALIETTARNLREVAPTIYFNVPKGYEMLLPYLRAEPDLRRMLFSKLRCLFYAGAALAPHIRSELEQMAIEATGRSIPMVTSLGSTETAPSAITVTAKASTPGVVGIPNRGVTMKLVPNAGKLEARFSGPTITPGYWRQPHLTAAAFDDEGFYRIGDALRFADPADPERGFIFDGRIAEDFKLATGTWVSVGPLRARLIATFAPLARDFVIAGHDRDWISAIAIPDPDGLAAFAATEVKAELAKRLTAFNASAKGSSERIGRLVLFTEPLSIDHGELTDKGSINQRAVLARRASLVERLYADAIDPDIVAT